MTPTRILFALTLVLPTLAGDWPTYGHDPQRTSWAFEETRLSPENAGKISLLWKTRLNNQPYSLFALTAPVAAGGISTRKGVRRVVYTAGDHGHGICARCGNGRRTVEPQIPVRGAPRQGRIPGDVSVSERHHRHAGN